MKKLLALTILLFLAPALISASAEEGPKKDDAAQAQKAPPPARIVYDEHPSTFGNNPTPTCIVDPVAVEDMKKLREEVEAKKKEFAAKELEIQAKEKALDEELKKLEALRIDITKIEESRKRENDDKVAKVVDALQSMKPSSSAQLLANMEEVLAVASIAKMDNAKLAKILNVMDPAKSSRLTELLAGVVRAKKITLSNDKAETTTVSAKGGE